VLACLLQGPREVKVCRVDIPRIPPGWVLIQVRYAGICGTDIAMYRWKYVPRKIPIIPGHEFVGVVVDVGSEVPRDIIGRKVVSEINVVCGRCRFCIRGLYTHCIYRKAIGIDIDGGFAEYVAVPYRNIHFVDDLDDLDAVLIEPAAAVLHAVNSIPRNVGRRCVIIGQGPLAYLAANIFEACGYSVQVVVKGGERVRYFKNFKIVTLQDVENVFKDVEDRPDIVFEASGSSTGIEYALKIVRPGGIIIAKSTHGEYSCIDYTKLVVNEITVIGSRCGMWDDWEHVIDMLRRGKLNLKSSITHIVDLENIEEGFKIADERRGLKVIVKCH